jgi:hypothetical protein
VADDAALDWTISLRSPSAVVASTSRRVSVITDRLCGNHGRRLLD